MRKRFNRNAVCSSENYSASSHSHKAMLSENHASFCEMIVSGEIVIAPAAPTYKIIRVFGKEMRISIEDFNKHNTLNIL